MLLMFFLAQATNCSEPITQMEMNHCASADHQREDTAMTAQWSARPTVKRNSMDHKDQFRKIYAGFVNGIAIPTEQVQHARLNDKTETIGIGNCMKSTNEKEWIEVKNKSKKVRFVKQDQFGKTK
jgi:hypothetical protein